MRALLLVAVLLFAGCAEQAQPTPDPAPVVASLSEKLFDILPVEEVWVAAEDGKRMNHAVFRPDTDEPVPVFINFSPYWGDTALDGGDAFSQYMIEEYVPRGYAVVLAGLRGTGHSEGCFQIGGDLELRDMHGVVDHFANEPWSNGAIATGGKSYDSSPTNGLIAKYPHPALRGVFHVSGITDMYAYNYKGGVPYATGPVFNTYYYLQGTDEYGLSLVGAGSPDDEDPESLARIIDDVACTELPQMQASGVGSGVHGMKDDYWIERDWTRYIGDSDWDGSIFFVHGLQDWNVKPDHILPWIDLLPEQIRLKGWLHQGAHVYPERQDWNETMLAWLDHELKGIDTGFWDEPRWEVESDDGTWYRHHAWPPAPLALADGVQGLEAGDYVVWGGDARAELAFDSDTHVSGAFVGMVIGTAATSDPVLVATLYDEAPGGGRTWVSEAVLRAIYRDGLENPQPLAPGDAVLAPVLSYAFDHVFPAGHRAVIEVGGAPRFAVTVPVQEDQLTDVAIVILAPVATAAPNDPQPASMRCFAC